MITSKSDYHRYLKFEQKNCSHCNFIYCYIKSAFNPSLRFLLLLRTCEYLKNTKKGIVSSSLYYLVKYLKYRQSLRTGFSIPENVAEEGLQLPHFGTIVINPKTKIGKHCKIHVCVNIGASGGSKEAPKIGNNVYFAPGVKVYGNIEIADRIIIAANAAVSKSFLNPGVIIGGIPAKEIGTGDVFKLINMPNIE